MRVCQVLAAAVIGLIAFAPGSAGAAKDGSGEFPPAKSLRTKTPIKHLAILFPENQSFDHYFGTYPRAENLSGEVPFEAAPDTPAINGLTPEVIANNPNAVKPYRVGPVDNLPCDPDHQMPEQERAINLGQMNMFVEESGDTCPMSEDEWPMAYFDGNTVTAHWNYAQRFAMSDAFHADVLGPSTPGHLNLIAGTTHGTVPEHFASEGTQYAIEGTLVDDLDPRHDDCSEPPLIKLRGETVGDLLSEEKVSWGYFQSGFGATRHKKGKAICGKKHNNGVGESLFDYIPHHEPFQYFEHLANPHHKLPTRPGMIGSTDRASHQYAPAAFWKAANRGNQPAVSFLKPAAWADGHAGYSNPLSEQAWLVKTINRLQRLDTWRKTAILIVYDDSGGWYDHVQPPLTNESAIPAFDALTGPGECGTPEPGAYQGRCGLGMRMPFVVISPFARSNYVDHRTTQQSSVLRFIEDNWRLGRLGDQSFDADAASIEPIFDFDANTPRLFLDQDTGAPQE